MRSAGGGATAAWRRAFVPLTFAPGEACQFDWSLGWVVMGGVTTKVKVAHIRLCYSRMRFRIACPRETQEPCGPSPGRIRAGQRREPVMAAWGFTATGARVLLRLMAGSKEDAETVAAFFQDMRGRRLGDPLLVVSDGAPAPPRTPDAHSRRQGPRGRLAGGEGPRAGGLSGPRPGDHAGSREGRRRGVRSGPALRRRLGACPPSPSASRATSRPASRICACQPSMIAVNPSSFGRFSRVVRRYPDGAESAGILRAQSREMLKRRAARRRLMPFAKTG